MRAIFLIFLFAQLVGCTGKSGGSPSTKSPVSASAAAATKSVQLSWTASTGSPTGYSVEQSTDNATYSTASTVSGTTATITGLTSGRTYYFRVKGYNSGGYSSASNVITITP